MAFQDSERVVGGACLAVGVAGVAVHSMLMGTLQAAAGHRAAQADADALDAWDRELRRARGDAAALGDLAKVAITAMLDAEDEVAALRAEVADLRRSVDQRDLVIHSLSASA